MIRMAVCVARPSAPPSIIRSSRVSCISPPIGGPGIEVTVTSPAWRSSANCWALTLTIGIVGIEDLVAMIAPRVRIASGCSKTMAAGAIPFTISSRMPQLPAHEPRPLGITTTRPGDDLAAQGMVLIDDLAGMGVDSHPEAQRDIGEQHSAGGRSRHEALTENLAVHRSILARLVDSHSFPRFRY